MRRILPLARKEFRQLRRDRISLAMMLMLPLLQLLLFGYAIDTDVRHVHTVVYDQDRSAASRRWVSHLEATQYNDVIGHVRSYDEIGRALRAGHADAAIVLPPRFERDLRSGRGSSVQLIVNGTDPQIVGSALGAAQGLAESVSSRIAVRRMDARGLRPSPTSVVVEPLVAYNPDRRTAVFVVPGLIGVILTMTLTMFTGMAIARERERGTLEALIVSPARPYEIVVGKILPYVGAGYLQMSVILLLGRWAFDVPVVGSVPLLFAVSGWFIAANLSVGLLFSTLARTQQQAMQMSFFFLLPNILLSGFMFPFSGMPAPAQWLAQCLPLTHFLRVVRRIVLAGAGYAEVAAELYWLMGIFGVLLVLASLRFRKKLL